MSAMFEHDNEERQARRAFTRRAILMGGGQLLGFSALAWRLFQLQVLDEGRSGRESASDKEVHAILRLPGPLRRAVVRVGRWLDAAGLLPQAMIDNDPLYASAFVANLGSVGLDAAYHHLFEHGTTPVFVTMGRVHRAPYVRDDGSVASREIFALKYTFDERTEDGFYAARALARLKVLLEDPALL